MNNSPVFNLMNGNPMNLLSQMVGGNPQTMLLNMLKAQNPQAFQQVQTMMQSGQNPDQILNQLTSQLTPQQMQQIRAMANQLGIR